MAVNVPPLPLYPSSRSRASLSPSQWATLRQNISSSLGHILVLPPSQRDTSATCAFIASYAKDSAQEALQSLIWEDQDSRSKIIARISQVERKIRQQVFLLAEKVGLVGLLDLPTMLDLSVAYGTTSPSRLLSLFSSVFGQTPTPLITEVHSQAIPAFTTLLSSPAQGLYGLRKTAHILLCFLRPAPPMVARAFAHNKPFMLALAKAYDDSLAAVSQSYGGLRLPTNEDQSRTVDQWERIFLETKVALIDSFHILIRTILDDIASVPTAGSALAAQCEPAFEIIFALLDLQSTHTTSATERATPFLNRPLLADYQDAYDLSRTLSDVLRRADDARTELLESTLRSLDASPSGPGALKLVLRSSGVPPGIDNRGNKKSEANLKGKERQVEPPTSREDAQVLDIAVSQVLDILPDQEPSYIRFLLSHRDYPYQGNAERLIEALLEGTAPRQEDVEIAMKAVESVVTPQSQTASRPQSGTFEYTKERRNVFDEDVMDLTKVRIGKKNDDTATVLQDRSFIEQMKADILRRAEEISDEEDEEDVAAVGAGKGKGQEITFEDELDEDVVKVRDGEESEDGQDDMEGEDGDIEEPAKTQPETILELAYLRDPKLFDRDGHTRRSKARADLKAQTGWSDEQIEGWKIMLERNPKKDQILSKHEFSGNKSGVPASDIGPSHLRDGHQSARGRGGRGRGGRGRGGRGGGQGHRQEGGSGGDGTARDRAWKDKNKASRGNHNRKRGHDKKMSRVGGPS